MELLEAVGLELQRRYTYADMDTFFATMNIDAKSMSWGDSGNSKRVYAKAVLGRASEADLLRVADELGLTLKGVVTSALLPPANWKDTKDFRLFISHISKHKDIATRLKVALEPYGIAGFVAHEDIHPTLAWMDEVERALQTMDALIAVHTDGFSKSYWTQQEVGFALGRGTKVISFKMAEDPTGFISKHQALARRNRTAKQIAGEISLLLGKDPRTEARHEEGLAAAQTRLEAARLEAQRTAAIGQPGRTDVRVGMRVNHAKFGLGSITEIEGNKLHINFDKIGHKRVLDAFVNVAEGGNFTFAA